ncbi:MAG: hypothetical protein LR011_11795 [Verrucomicrobia bacterium]|nr:hypothetical protein [Verrucomicrobiota bacterium]
MHRILFMFLLLFLCGLNLSPVRCLAGVLESVLVIEESDPNTHEWKNAVVHHWDLKSGLMVPMGRLPSGMDDGKPIQVASHWPSNYLFSTSASGSGLDYIRFTGLLCTESVPNWGQEYLGTNMSSVVSSHGYIYCHDEENIYEIQRHYPYLQSELYVDVWDIWIVGRWPVGMRIRSMDVTAAGYWGLDQSGKVALFLQKNGEFSFIELPDLSPAHEIAAQEKTGSHQLYWGGPSGLVCQHRTSNGVHNKIISEMPMDDFAVEGEYIVALTSPQSTSGSQEIIIYKWNAGELDQLSIPLPVSGRQFRQISLPNQFGLPMTNFPSTGEPIFTGIHRPLGRAILGEPFQLSFSIHHDWAFEKFHVFRGDAHISTGVRTGPQVDHWIPDPKGNDSGSYRINIVGPGFSAWSPPAEVHFENRTSHGISDYVLEDDGMNLRLRIHVRANGPPSVLFASEDLVHWIPVSSVIEGVSEDQFISEIIPIKSESRFFQLLPISSNE